MARPILALLVFVSTAFAGCTKDPDGATEVDPEDCDLEPALCDPTHYMSTHHCIQDNIHPRIYAPDTPGPDSDADPWELGDYWKYDLTVDGDQQVTELVYFDDIDFNNGKAQHYLVGVKDRAEALDHALFSVNPMLGRIHRTLYSPHESGVHADMFYFPLCEGSKWKTGFYDTEFSVTAHRKTLELPDGTTDPLGFEMTGTGPGGATLRHTYSSKVKWFTEIEVHTEEVDVEMELLEWGSGKTGRYEFMRAQQDEVVDLSSLAFNNAGRATFAIEREDGGEGAYDKLALWLDVSRSGQGRIEVHLRDPGGTSRACVGFDGSGVTGDSECPSGPLMAEVPYQAGTWQITVERPPLDGTTVAGVARVVSFYDRGGNV